MQGNQTNAQGRSDGTMFNLKQDTGEKTPEGKTVWKSIGRAFIANDLSAGTLYVGEGDTERKYRLFPKDRKPRPQTQVQKARAELPPPMEL